MMTATTPSTCSTLAGKVSGREAARRAKTLAVTRMPEAHPA